MSEIPKPRGVFLRITCPDCGNKQNIFDRASTQVNCLVCGATLAKPQGGKAALRGKTKPVE